MSFASNPSLPGCAGDLYETVRDLPIVSPHGHCDPRWWVNDARFPDPVTLLITPDHYVFRMLYSQGVSLAELGVGVSEDQCPPRAIFQRFADHWHCFLGTPSRAWLEFTLYRTLGVTVELSPQTAIAVYDQIVARLADVAFRPRALFDAFGIELLATTDAATDALEDHRKIQGSDWDGRVIPTFRPDSILNPARSDFNDAVVALAEQTGEDLSSLDGYLTAIRIRREFFRSVGATATDHDVPMLTTEWLGRREVERLFAAAMAKSISHDDAQRFYAHMLVEMAQMSVEDGLVMQIHVGSSRNTNQDIFNTFGPDKGADIPISVNWVRGLDGMLNRVGNNPDFRLIAFGLDESSYSRELAPMAGHWPCLRLGPPWWFHDSPNGIRRYFDRVVETAGYQNLAGFNDDTRAFLSIPARHDLWRQGVALHLAAQVEESRFSVHDAEWLARALTRDLAIEAYRLDGDAL